MSRKPGIPNEIVRTNDIVSNKFYDNIFEFDQKTTVITSNRNDSDKLSCRVLIQWDEIDHGTGPITASKTLSAYERNVHDAIVSLYVNYQNGNPEPGKSPIFSTLDIYKTMTGDERANIQVDSKSAQDIENALRRARSTIITIDATSEARKYKNMKITKLEDPLIHYTLAECLGDDGRRYTLFKILTEPILYYYANAKNQILRTDLRQINTPIKKTQDNIALQGYLERRISVMKKGKLSREIKYSSILEALQIEKQDRTQKRRMCVSIAKIFDYWISTGFIIGYDIIAGDHNSVQGYKINYA